MPTGSLLVSDSLIEDCGSKQYNILRFKRVLELADIFLHIVNFDASQIIALRPKIVSVIKVIRKMLGEDVPAEDIFLNLEKSGLLRELKSSVLDVAYGQYAILQSYRGGFGMIPDRTREVFKNDHPGRCVFLMICFPSMSPTTDGIDRKLHQIIERIRNEVSKYRGLELVVANDKNYADNDWLWDNIKIYMELSEFGIAVLENFRQDEINPNVAVEFGYMQGLGKKVLLLKEKGFNNINADLLGRIWKPFNANDLTTLDEAIENFFGVDLSIPKKRI